MPEVLKKYILSNSSDSTQKQYNINLSKGTETEIPLDYNRPLTYPEWATQNTALREDLRKSAYQKYVEDWHANRFDKQTSDDIVKNQYKQLIERLQFVFKDDPNFKRLTNINLDDPYDIEVLIPLISKKLRDIALYYVQQRSTVKRSKIKYNVAGSEGAIEKLFGEYILKNFTSAKYQTTIIEQSALAALPQLSSIKNDFKIIIQELYDTSTYFDKSSKNKSIYADLKDTFVTEFCNVSAGQEFYNDIGVYDVLIDNPLFFDLAKYISDASNMAASATINLDGLDSNKINEFKATAKYLGTNLYYISGGYYIPKIDQLTLNIQTGSNLFYWPSGEFVYTGINSPILYNELPINESNFLTAGYAAADFANADKIFVNRCGYGIKGAWLQKGNTIPVEDVFKIEIQGSLKCEGRTSMRYPFPGRGYFVDGIWTGIQTNGLINKTYFTEQELAELETLYWNTTINDVLSTATALEINDSFLIEDGAFPGKLYSQADHFWIRQTTNPNKIEDENPNGVFNDPVKDYWLYKFQKTCLPIKASSDLSAIPTITNGNHIFWPYQSTDSYSSYNELPSYLVNRYKIALPVALSELDVYKEFGAAKAGSTVFDSDVIFKLDECGNIKEAAMLLGYSVKNLVSTSYTDKHIFPNKRLNNFNYTLSDGYIQPGLVFKATAGNTTPFMWQVNGAKFGDIEDVPNTRLNNLNAFRGVKHEPNCPYYNANIKSLYYHKDEAEKNTLCTCKAINYSPLGHKGNTLDSFNTLCDLIFEITTPNDITEFDINTWRDSNNRTWRNSDRIAYFKLDNDNKDKDVGWGTGKWVTPTGAEFFLQPGIIYGYYRNGKLMCSKNLNDLYLIVNHLYCNTKEYPAIKEELCYAYTFIYDFRPRWVDLEINSKTDISNWKIKRYEKSSMIFKPGDHLVYFHRDKNKFSLRWTNVLSTTPEQFFTPELTNFIWQSKLYGWDYENNKWSGSPLSFGARPYWSQADELCASNEFNLSIGNSRSLVYDYLFVNQPTFTTDVINHFDTIEYFRRNENSFIWKQGFTSFNSTASNVWRSIDLVEKEPYIKQNCAVETQSAYQCYDFSNGLVTVNSDVGVYNEIEAFDKILIVQSISAESDIIFEASSLDQPVSILYCAKNSFTYTQQLTDISVGLPPSGGIYVPVTSGILVKAEAPYANILNVNNPTVAFTESSSNIFTNEELGIYTPSNIALGIYNGSMVEKEVNVNNDYRDQIFSILDPQLYINNRGLSEIDSEQILKIKSTDASHLKYPPTAGCKSGDVRNSNKYANFNAYQSSYETFGNDSLSIPFDEKFDPWIGPEEANWYDTVNFTKNLYGEYNILSGDQSWYETRFNETNKIIHKAQTDIFGNYYILFKSSAGFTMHASESLYGTLYVKDLNNKTLPAASALNNLYNLYKINYPVVYNHLTANHIKDITVYYDTLVTEIPNYILIDRISENFETGEIFINTELKQSSSSDSSFVISLSAPINNASTVLISDDNILTIAYMISSTSYATPIFYEHILGNDIVIKIYDGTNDYNTLYGTISSYNLNEFMSPKLAYDVNSNIYTFTILGKNTTLYNDAFFTIFYNFKREDKFRLKSINVLKPFTS